MNRIYHYHVNIRFRGKGHALRIGRRYSEYIGSHGFRDTFVFFPKSCSMVLSRTRSYVDGEILSKANNSINTQIIKALLCYYAVSDDFPIVESISIVRKKSGQPDYTYTECDNILQPIGNCTNRMLVCSENVLDILLEETQKGQTLRIAMSYWLKGISSDDVYYKFDHLWRAFNRLFMYHGNHSKEFECMRAIRSLIINNAANFPRSISITNNYSTSELHSFRWSRMILNDYETRAKNQALVDFVFRYHDGRIMELFREKLACRRAFLHNDPRNLETLIDNYLNQNSGVRIDAELVTILTIKYAYFVRNKVFHGEVTDGTFKVMPNNIDNEMTKLNQLLEVIVLELMENYHLLRN